MMLTHWNRWSSWSLAACVVALLLVACNGLTDVPLPANVADPATMRTAAGAITAYKGALVPLRDGLSSFVGDAGVLSDELQSWEIGSPTGVFRANMEIDSRALPEDGTTQNPGNFTYAQLNRLRGQAREALGLLAGYAPESSPALRGHLYALTAYAQVMLGELFCSGIPLSTLDFDADYTLTGPLSTEEVLTRSVTLFDTALTLSGDSARFVNLARIGRARALLGLGQFGEAAQAVAEVPDGYSYQVGYNVGTGTANARNVFQVTNPGPYSYTVSDREGQNGLDYISSGDPRTGVAIIRQNIYGLTWYHPTPKYAQTGASPIVLADWVEARLIEAEAALQAGDVTTWLGKLNHLRQTARTPALPDTTDPGTDASRVDLLFRERAFWLFLTGHRQGDLRRLVRQYGRDVESIYPTGLYAGANGGYGTDVTLPVPIAERVSNPLFTGCVSRDP
jgi:hypothetical protein